MDLLIEKANVRLVRHMLHAAKEMVQRVVILSRDTDVLVIATYNFNMLHLHGLQTVDKSWHR